MSSAQLENVQEHDARLAQIAKPIQVLSALAWPKKVGEQFLEAWRAGRPALPEVHLEPRDHRREVAALEDLQDKCDRSHPLDNVIFKMARSYATACLMLGAVGTPAFSQYSIALYGKPDDAYKTQNFTALDAADFFLLRTDELLGSYAVPEVIADIPTETFAQRLQAEIDEFFTDDKVEVVIDTDLPSKAIAGSKRVRLRAGTMFSVLDLDQLLQHEAFVHSATMLNGRRQKNFRALALGAPRTTRTQEGIAVLAELITLSLDVSRLRRVALRIKAVDMALHGADFIDVFKSFLEAGQTEEESYQSTMRCFRGGDVTGKAVFTKDTVYLKGMMEVYTFLAVCIHNNRPELAAALFAGRLTLGDIVELASYFDNGFLNLPHYVPFWARDLRRLASVFACNAFFMQINLANIQLDNFVHFEERVAIGDV